MKYLISAMILTNLAALAVLSSTLYSAVFYRGFHNGIDNMKSIAEECYQEHKTATSEYYECLDQ